MNAKTIRVPMAVLAAAVVMSPVVMAGDSITAALVNGKVSADLRYRFEHVTQDNDLRDATASTLRTLLGYETGTFYGFSARLEFNNTAVVGSERYNSGPNGNGRAQFSVIPDPRVTRVNQAYLDYTGLPDTLVRLGNQRIMLDNVRFIGNVGFRQQEQTYEGVRIVNKSIPQTTIDYTYVQRVNRIFFDTSNDVDHHFLNINFGGLDIGAITGYGYFLDYDAAADAASSTATIGARFAGGHDFDGDKRLLYGLEFARQEDHGNFDGSYSADYQLVELGAVISGITIKARYELLGADEDAGKAFETRLATLHVHNGWADQFLATPATGLEDTSLTVSAVVDGILLAAVYHDYRSDIGGTRYGTEYGLRARKSFGRHYALEAKYASYQAKDLLVDTDKLWLTGEMKF